MHTTKLSTYKIDPQEKKTSNIVLFGKETALAHIAYPLCNKS